MRMIMKMKNESYRSIIIAHARSNASVAVMTALEKIQLSVLEVASCFACGNVSLYFALAGSG